MNEGSGAKIVVTEAIRKRERKERLLVSRLLVRNHAGGLVPSRVVEFFSNFQGPLAAIPHRLFDNIADTHFFKGSNGHLSCTIWTHDSLLEYTDWF